MLYIAKAMQNFIKLTIIILLLPASLIADDCLDWFKDLNIKQGNDCLTSCLIAPVGMGTFACTKRCKEFCSNKNEKTEYEYLAKTLYGEARGENYESMVAIAWVIRNRVTIWKSTYQKIVMQPQQFSCWNRNDPNYDNIQNPNDDKWKTANEISHGIIDGKIANPVPNVVHYYSPKSMRPSGSRPYWSKPENELTLPNVPNFIFVKQGDVSK